MCFKEEISRKNYRQPILFPVTHSYPDYNTLKPQVLEAEQHLLRILGFDFGQAHKNSNEGKTILVLIHQLRRKNIKTKYRQSLPRLL